MTASITLAGAWEPSTRRGYILIEDVTEVLRGHISSEMVGALKALTDSGIFGRETLSAAVGEISEHLVARALGASRVARNSRGHDLCFEGTTIEVKSRFISRWGESLQFNFGVHTAKAGIAYCLAWKGDDGGEPALQQAFRVTVPFLIERWRPLNSTGKYCARTDLGALRRALTEAAGV